MREFVKACDSALLHIDGHLFRRRNSRDETIYWHCKENKCPCGVETYRDGKGEHVLKRDLMKNQHNHYSNWDEVQKLKDFRNKRRPEDDNTASHTLQLTSPQMAAAENHKSPNINNEVTRRALNQHDTQESIPSNRYQKTPGLTLFTINLVDDNDNPIECQVKTPILVDLDEHVALCSSQNSSSNLQNQHKSKIPLAASILLSKNKFLLSHPFHNDSSTISSADGKSSNDAFLKSKIKSSNMSQVEFETSKSQNLRQLDKTPKPCRSNSVNFLSDHITCDETVAKTNVLSPKIKNFHEEIFLRESSNVPSDLQDEKQKDPPIKHQCASTFKKAVPANHSNENVKITKNDLLPKAIRTITLDEEIAQAKFPHSHEATGLQNMKNNDFTDNVDININGHPIKGPIMMNLDEENTVIKEAHVPINQQSINQHENTPIANHNPSGNIFFTNNRTRNGLNAPNLSIKTSKFSNPNAEIIKREKNGASLNPQNIKFSKDSTNRLQNTSTDEFYKNHSARPSVITCTKDSSLRTSKFMYVKRPSDESHYTSSNNPKVPKMNDVVPRPYQNTPRNNISPGRSIRSNATFNNNGLPVATPTSLKLNESIRSKLLVRSFFLDLCDIRKLPVKRLNELGIHFFES